MIEVQLWKLILFNALFVLSVLVTTYLYAIKKLNSFVDDQRRINDNFIKAHESQNDDS